MSIGKDYLDEEFELPSELPPVEKVIQNKSEIIKYVDNILDNIVYLKEEVNSTSPVDLDDVVAIVDDIKRSTKWIEDLLDKEY